MMNLSSIDLTKDVDNRLDNIVPFLKDRVDLHQIVTEVLAVLVERGFMAYEDTALGITSEPS